MASARAAAYSLGSFYSATDGIWASTSLNDAHDAPTHPCGSAIDSNGCTVCARPGPSHRSGQPHKRFLLGAA